MIEAGLRIIKPPATFYETVPCIFEEDPEFGFRFIPNSGGLLHKGFEINNEVRLNNLGFHDINRRPEQTTNPRVLVLGDSFVAAAEVPVDKGWTQGIERELADTAVEVINLGISGTGTDQHLAVLQHYAPQFKPDLVILAFYQNDFEDIRVERKLACAGENILVFQTTAQKENILNFIEEHRPSPFIRWLGENWYLFRAVAPFLDKDNILLQTNTIAPGTIDMDIEPAKELEPGQLDALFNTFLAQAEAEDFQFIIIPIPDRDNPSASLETLKAEVSPDILKELIILDVGETIANKAAADGREYKELYYIYDSHFNEDGYRLLGEAVAEAIRPYLDSANP